MEGKMKIEIQSESTIGKTVFTLDGSRPTVDSQEYEKELFVSGFQLLSMQLLFGENDEGDWVSGELSEYKVEIPVLKKISKQ